MLSGFAGPDCGVSQDGYIDGGAAEDDELMIGTPPPPPAPKGCPDDVWQAMIACMRFQMKQATKDVEEVVKNAVGEQIGGINNELQGMKSDLTTVKGEVNSIKVQNDDFSKRIEALERGNMKSAASSHQRNPYEDAAAAAPASSVDAASVSPNIGAQSASPFTRVPVDHSNWRSKNGYNGGGGNWNASSAFHGWPHTSSSRTYAPALTSGANEEVPKDGIEFIVGGWDYNTHKDKINNDLVTLKPLLSDPARNMIKIFKAGSQLARVANCQMVPQTTRRDFWSLRDEILEAMETHNFKLANGAVPYIAPKKDPDTRLVDRKMGEIFRAICAIRGCEFKPQEKQRARAMHVGVERLWGPHHVIFVENRKVCWWDHEDFTVMPDFDNLKKVNMTWDNVLAKASQMAVELARRSS